MFSKCKFSVVINTNPKLTLLKFFIWVFKGLWFYQKERETEKKDSFLVLPLCTMYTCIWWLLLL